MTARKFIDSTTEEGTRQLCRLIQNHWKKHGYANITAVPVLLRLDPNSKLSTSSCWGINSNLGPGGFPVGESPERWVTR